MTETASEAPWTIQRVLNWSTDDFRQRHIESPRLEAEVLLAHVLGTDRMRLILDASRPLTSEELGRYREVIRRRRGREPLAYIVGHREFYGFDFLVDQRVLIPRPDTEVLVETALQATSSRHLSGRALDLCTGSGCVAIAFKKHRPTWQVLGTDRSLEALDVARSNALRLGTVWGLAFAAGDLFDAVDDSLRFDLITANPPYVEHEEIARLEPEVRAHEPLTALDGGADGLDFLPRIAEGSLRYLRPGGTLAVEIGAGQAQAVAALFEHRGFVDVSRHRDYGGHDRVVSARLPE